MIFCLSRVISCQVCLKTCAGGDAEGGGEVCEGVGVQREEACGCVGREGGGGGLDNSPYDETVTEFVESHVTRTAHPPASG